MNEWDDARIRARVDAFAAATRSVGWELKEAQAEALRDEAEMLPRATGTALVRRAAALVINKMRTSPSKEEAQWASVLDSLLGIDWAVEENPL